MIVTMRHLDLVCVAAEREATLKRLRDFGAVHLDLAAAAGAAIDAAKSAESEAEQAVRLILKARESQEAGEVRERSVADILALDADRERLKSAAEELRAQIRFYEPYGDFDPELARRLLEQVEGLRDYVDLPAELPEKRLSVMREKLARVEHRAVIDTCRLAGCDERALLRKFPALADKIAFEQARELLRDHGAVAVISGWVPEPSVAGLRQCAAEAGWGLLLRAAAVGENPPTLIEPPRFARPVKALFAGLGIAPAYDESDVSVPFFAYFALFFAMLVGDGAYGAIFLAVTLLMRRKLPRAWFVLLSVFSLATVAWGFLSDTWFGATLLQTTAADGSLVPRWAWAEPLLGPARWLAGAGAQTGHEYDNMMFLCFTIGVSHLLLARLWNAICRINSRTCLSEFGWAGVVLFMYVLTNFIVGIFGSIPTWCFAVFGVSFVLLFVQAKGMDKGMLFLNTMSVLGDIISYVRLFAVGLASVKVAQNFNAMAVGLDLPIWLKALPLVLILLVGHGLNLAMAGLSVLVHAVRLNTLEFSNHKGVSWAGYVFRPFRRS